MASEVTMEDIRSIQLRRLHGRLGEVVYQLTKVQFSSTGSPQTWQPAINAYRCSDCVVICMDLAGVDRDQIQLTVESNRLRIRGQRRPPEPEGADRKPVQVLLMEIDYGFFERQVVLPFDLDPERVTAEQRNGLLWIYLGLRAQA